jgi:hypothetical protein
MSVTSWKILSVTSRDVLLGILCFQKNGLPTAAQIHRISNTVTTVVVLPFDISPLADVFRREQEPAKDLLF